VPSSSHELFSKVIDFYTNSNAEKIERMIVEKRVLDKNGIWVGFNKCLSIN